MTEVKEFKLAGRRQAARTRLSRPKWHWLDQLFSPERR